MLSVPTETSPVPTTARAIPTSISVGSAVKIRLGRDLIGAVCRRHAERAARNIRRAAGRDIVITSRADILFSEEADTVAAALVWAVPRSVTVIGKDAWALGQALTHALERAL